RAADGASWRSTARALRRVTTGRVGDGGGGSNHRVAVKVGVKAEFGIGALRNGLEEDWARVGVGCGRVGPVVILVGIGRRGGERSSRGRRVVVRVDRRH